MSRGRTRRAVDVAVPVLAALWRRYYALVVGASVSGGVLAMGRPFLRRHGTAPPLPHNDSVILEYAGWFVASGNTLYVDIWEIKPPLAFLPPYLFAGLTGQNMYAHHLLGIATLVVAMGVTAGFVARIVGRVTGAPLAGVAAGLALFALPDLFYRPWLGYKTKPVVFALGTAALDRALRDRWFGSGLWGGLAVGVWQLAALFPVLTAAYALQRRGTAALRRAAAGWTVAAGAVGLALVAYADVGGFLAQVVLGPLVLATEGGGFSPATYVRYFPGTTGYWLTAAGAGGLALALVRSGYAAARPLALGGLLTAGMVALVDFDGLWDMLSPLVFLALGVGLLVGALPREARVAAVVALGLAVAPAFAPSAFVKHDPVDPKPSDGLPPSVGAEREHVYWTAQPIESCRFFGSRTQRSALRFYPDAETLRDAPCGDPEPYWAALVGERSPEQPGGNRSAVDPRGPVGGAGRTSPEPS